MMISVFSVCGVEAGCGDSVSGSSDVYVIPDLGESAAVKYHLFWRDYVGVYRVCLPGAFVRNVI